MLNELLILERGMQDAGIGMSLRHPDIKDSRQIPTLQVLFDDAGHVATVRPIPSGVMPWTLRDGQHNSFPFVQPKHPLWLVSDSDERQKQALDVKGKNRRDALFSLANDCAPNITKFAGWPGAGLLERVRERRDQLASLETNDGAVVLATMSRFLLACDPHAGGDPLRMLQEIVTTLVNELREFPGQDWLDVAASVLVSGTGAFMFDASGGWPSILDAAAIGALSAAMRQQSSSAASSHSGSCGLTGGEPVLLVDSTFPQPNLPLLGQTYLFARNKDAPANDRYGKFSAGSMPVSQDMVIRLSAAIEAITSDDRRNITWRAIPGEAPKQSDLLVAFVEKVPDAAVVETLTDDESHSEDEPASADDDVDSVARFEKRTTRLIDHVRAKLSRTPEDVKVQLVVFRKLDPANRKVVYASQPTVGDLRDAAADWIAGERNVPPWLTLPVLKKKDRKVVPMSPPHVAPLGFISFSRQIYIQGGVKHQEISGVAAAEALGLFLDTALRNNRLAMNRATRLLHLVLQRRGSLVSGVAHALRRGFKAAKEYDRREALRTVSVLGILLHKLGPKENYMSHTAFKLGQLLAAADVVHVGYCAAVRGGDIPPSLLGNQVFAIAQGAPERALAILCRRWKPYDGWAKKAAREPTRAATLIASDKPDDRQRGWDIRRALRHAREMRPLATELATLLPGCPVTEQFRAELLLGYIAGLPKAQQEDESGKVQDLQTI